MTMNREKFQSETGRGIDSLVSSSPLFYTVSGSQSPKQSPRYYEQLGCPSILKPSFRDLTGCTRLSVGVPSYSSFPLDKLNKTMGKSPTTQSKRYGRGEKNIPPIKVNAKIRHIYSHITSSPTTTSQRSSIATTSTQTELDVIENGSNLLNAFSEEKVENDIPSKKDASTCMSPPPQPELPSTSDGNRLFTVPPPYAGKLEDLEKITGHIVIQRFFTRADEAFGSWLEKQLGMNNKSVGVGTVEPEVTEDSDKPQSGFMHIKNTSENTLLKLVDAFEPEICSVTDTVKCECFRDYHESQEAESSLQKDFTSNLSQIEQELISQCVEYEVTDGMNLPSTAYENPAECVQTDLVQKPDETEDKRLQGTSVIEDLEETETASQVGDEELDKRLKLLDLEWLREEKDEANNVVNSQTDARPEDQIEDLAVRDSSSLTTALASNVIPPVVAPPVSEELADDSQLELDIEDASPEQIQTLLTEQIFVFPTPKCIPDVIEVSDLMKLEKSLTEQTTDSQNQARNQLIESDTISTALESQSKVAEYLADLEKNTSVDFPGNEKTIYDQIDQGESSDRSQKLLKEGEMTSGQEKGSILKRSISVDSCIGTESSGEARNGRIESCTPVDSGRTVQDDLGMLGICSQGQSEIVSESQKQANTIELESKDSWERQDSQDQEVITIMSSKSIDESNNSRSEMSSAIKQGSDGEDADQSESDSEFSSLRRPTGSVMSAVVEEIEREDIENALLVQDDEDDDEDEMDEVDEFDAIIESHEKEKRLRPVCRKRNATTQTTKSVEVESSIISASTTSRSTTATSDSSFDLEFVSKSKKFVSQLSSGNNSMIGDKRRSYLPSGSSSLNVLNMKFTMGREFESEVSIRIPPKSPGGSVSSQKGSGLPMVSGTATAGTSGRNEKGRSSQQQSRGGQDSELKNLWKDVKFKMDSRVSESRGSVQLEEMHVRGNRLKLISADDAEPFTDSNLQRRMARNEVVELAPNEEEKIKRSLKKLKKILDD